MAEECGFERAMLLSGLDLKQWVSHDDVGDDINDNGNIDADAPHCRQNICHRRNEFSVIACFCLLEMRLNLSLVLNKRLNSCLILKMGLNATQQTPQGRFYCIFCRTEVRTGDLQALFFHRTLPHPVPKL